MSEPFCYQKIKTIGLLDKIKLLFEKELCDTCIARIDGYVYVYKTYYKILNENIYYTKEKFQKYKIDKE